MESLSCRPCPNCCKKGPLSSRKIHPGFCNKRRKHFADVSHLVNLSISALRSVAFTWILLLILVPSVSVAFLHPFQNPERHGKPRWHVRRRIFPNEMMSRLQYPFRRSYHAYARNQNPLGGRLKRAHWVFHGVSRRITLSRTAAFCTNSSLFVENESDDGSTNAESGGDKCCRTIYTIDYCPSTDPTKLRGIVSKHVETLSQYVSRRPIAYHTQIAFGMLRSQLRKQLADGASNNAPNDCSSSTGDWFLRSRSIVLDSGCGTGRSTILLGQKFPESIVIGVDRSLLRLTKNQNVKKVYIPIEYSDGELNYFADKSYRPRIEKNTQDVTDINDYDGFESYPTRLVEQVTSNVWLVRAELVDFWRLMIQYHWHVQHHFMLYPNPYPKLTRVQQRWYAHPSFPLLFQLFKDPAKSATRDVFMSKTLTIRSNWKQYLIEFAESARCARTIDARHCSIIDVGDVNEIVRPSSFEDIKLLALTNFEEKYWLVKEPTYELVLMC